MHKKHMFLRVFSKITILVCVFCTLSAWADTTTCDINFTPVTGNSWQNGTPTPTSPVEIESVGTKVGNKYQVSVVAGNQGVVDLGTLTWIAYSGGKGRVYLSSGITDRKIGIGYGYLEGYTQSTVSAGSMDDGMFAGGTGSSNLYIRDDRYTDATSFKEAMSGKMFHYQRTTDGSWIAPTIVTVYLDEPLRKVGDYADVLDYKKGQIIRNVGVYKLADLSWKLSGSGAGRFYINSSPLTDLFASDGTGMLSNGFATKVNNASPSSLYEEGLLQYTNGGSYKGSFYVGYNIDTATLTEFKAMLESIDAKLYYPLATPVVEQIENWSCPVIDIKIATTKFVDEEFAVAEAKLATTVQTIESVVSRTITQTGQIATLHETKQTRPDESCPANMKCLLVQDEDGTPHWYPIIEP